MKVYIVRHGQTYFNVMGRVQGWCDSPLTKQGIQQAEHLASYFESIPLASGYHSGSERAADTLDLILKDREVPRKRDKRFKEVFFGDYEGELIRNIFPDGKVIQEEFYAHGGENRHEAAMRFFMAIQDLERQEQGDILIVSHGSVIRQFLEEHSKTFFQRAKEQNLTRALVPNCSVSVVEIKEGKVRVLELPRSV
ncbi:putative phosphoglycerate mutase [Faecalicoccus acidiformans]|uniref:Histidine phosphatase family protein n=1 Tax=Faecalicoccus acidiformans TaxID=915173 RepID=A0A7W8D3I1_9FIRM|nr:histidine phosphatase family protein [Faecalicoccus acidiformans]MBB5185268.1 putative phosphoglycerate mutase [Faecalicoccus acidiformans]MBM6831915.1 histidine phosphatase family protein [Faecalicoccus acidiformans]MDM8203596.1 histidine phosphatase family protein [Faecalicoccus acidiformans]